MKASLSRGLLLIFICVHLLLSCNEIRKGAWNSITIGGSANDEARAVVMAENGSIVVAGVKNCPDSDEEKCRQRLNPGCRLTVMKLDRRSNILWEYSEDKQGSGINAVLPVQDGYIIGGYKNDSSSTRDIFITKIDTDGKEIWTPLSFGSPDGDDEAMDIFPVSAGFVVTGYRSGEQKKDLWILELSSDGKQKSEEYFSKIPEDDAGYSLAQSGDGNYIVAGYRTTVPISNFWVTGINPSSKKLNELGFLPDPATAGSAKSIVKTSANNFIVTGYIFQKGKGRDIITAMFDQGGDCMWKNQGAIPCGKIVSTSSDEEANSIIETENGDFLLGGYRKINDARKMLIIRLNKTGSLINDFVIEGGSNDEACILLEDQQGSFIAGGYQTISSQKGEDIWLNIFD